MPNHSDSESPLDRIARERSMRVRGRPFIFLWDVDRRDDAFSDALLVTLEQFPDHRDREFAEVEQTFNENAQTAVNRLRDGYRKEGDVQDAIRGGYVSDPGQAGYRQGPGTRSAIRHEHSVAEGTSEVDQFKVGRDAVVRFEEERLQFVRMVIRRHYLPPDEAFEPAARAACRERGIADPTEDQIEEEVERLRRGDLLPRKRTTRERLADIDHYWGRVRELALRCAGEAQTTALALVSGMERVRRQQVKSNHSKKSKKGDEPSVPLFARLRGHACQLSRAFRRPNPADPDLILGILANFEMFASLFPRADQLGRCLRLSRLLADVGYTDPLGREFTLLRGDLESLHVLAKIHESVQDRLADQADRLAHLVTYTNLDESLRGAMYLAVLWLRTACVHESPQGHDELPERDASWWFHSSANDPDGLCHVVTAINRLYRSRSGKTLLNRKEN
jgi:hypothetical protein